MTRPALDRAVLGSRLAQIAQLMGTYDSKTDQTAQTDQRIENAGKFGAPLGQKPTSRHPKLTSGTAHQAHSRARGRRVRLIAPTPGGRAGAAAMSALPLIEAVRRAGGAIALQGDRLRLSAPEPLPESFSRSSDSTRRS